MRYILVTLFLAVNLIASSTIAETQLMMVEEDSCPWCKRWHAEVGDVYNITEEGKVAPLLQHDIHANLPDGIVLDSPPQYTPTFILLVDGSEVNRIEGYPGEDFFWGLLGIMLKDLPTSEQALSGT